MSNTDLSVAVTLLPTTHQPWCSRTKYGRSTFEATQNQNAEIIQYRHDTGTNLSIGEPPVGLADPVEAEDEEHRPRERAPGPQHRLPPPPRQPRAALIRIHEQRAGAAHQVVEQEHEHTRDEAEREEQRGGQRQPRRLRRGQRAAAHGPVRVPARVGGVPGVQLLRCLPRRGRRGGAVVGGEERVHGGAGVGARARRVGGVEGHCARRGAERRAGSARRDEGSTCSVTRTLSGRRWPLCPDGGG